VAFAFLLEADSIELSRRRFTTLPIRIGRNPLNDCPIVHPHISNFHARISDVGGRLCVEDLESKNGVYVPTPGATLPTALKPHEPVDLQAHGFQFFLGPVIKITVRLEHAQDALDDRLAHSFSGSVLGNRNAVLGGPSIPPPGGPSLPPPPGLAQPGPPPGVPSGAAQGFPGAGSGAPNAGLRRGPSTQFFTDLGPEFLALQGLRELAQSLVPGANLETTGDVARFITKLHDALEAFLRSAVPLREGYAQFIACFDLPHAPRRGGHRSVASAAVENASTPEELARALLDPADRTFDAPRTLEGVFADLMMHQMAVLDGMMRGVRALLEQLSPQSIASQAGHSFPIGQKKAYWETYVRKFEELYEERNTFAIVFGPEFAAAYRRYRQGGTSGG
jgi:type VI secretion system protein ImpI